MNKKVITSGDVAKLAEVSQSAVSRAFTPGASVAPDTRDRILKAAATLGYRPNALARAMNSGRSRLIALLVTYMDNEFYPPVVDHLTRALQDEGYSVLLSIPDGDTDKQDKMVEQIMQYQVEGMILASTTLSSNIAVECGHTGIPIVLLNRYPSTAPASTVISDNISGGAMVAEFLIAGGHHRIAFIAGDENTSTSRDREAGFYQKMAERGVSVFARRVGDYQHRPARQVVRELFTQQQVPDAVFVANDHMAFAVMDVLRDELRLRIPEDVSVVGFDNVPLAASAAYNLTTVEQVIPEMVDSTVHILLSQIKNRQVEELTMVLPVNLVIRGSAKRPRP